MIASISASELVRSPSLYVQKMDLLRETLFVVRMDRAQYRAASFLDDRILDGAGAVGWVPFMAIESVAKHIRPLPIHFIFHAGHVGSTLLSRLLDEIPSVLGLREPVPLRMLAEMRGHPSPVGLDFSRALTTLLPLWGRGYENTGTVIVKATSIAGAIAPQVMAAAPNARAVYLNLPAETYICTLLAGENSQGDLEGLTHDRLSRLKRILGVVADAAGPLTVGEGAAVAWLAERFAQSRAAALGTRLLSLDFDRLLENIEGTLARVLAHFSLPAEAARLAQSPILTRYAKLPESHTYSREMRRDLLAQTRRLRAPEIAQGMALLDRLGASYPAVAALMTTDATGPA